MSLAGTATRCGGLAQRRAEVDVDGLEVRRVGIGEIRGEDLLPVAAQAQRLHLYPHHLVQSLDHDPLLVVSAALRFPSLLPIIGVSPRHDRANSGGFPLHFGRSRPVRAT